MLVFSHLDRLLDSIANRIITSVRGLSLADIPVPSDITPFSVIDNVLRPAGNNATRMKMALTKAMQKAARDTHLLIVDAERLPHAWPIQANVARKNEKKPYPSPQEEQDLLRRFKRLLHTYCDSKETKAAFERHMSPQAILALMSVDSMFSVDQRGVLQPKTSFLIPIRAHRMSWDGHNTETETVRFSHLCLAANSRELTTHLPSSLADRIHAQTQLTKNIFALVHEAAHAGEDTEHTDKVFSNLLAHDPHASSVVEKNFTDFHETEKQRIRECSSDIAGFIATLNICGKETALPYAKLHVCYRLCEALNTNGHDHLTSPALAPLIGEKDSKFAALTQEIVPLSPAELYMGIKEAHEILTRRSMKEADYLDASFVAKPGPARTLLRTTHILRHNLQRRTI